MKSRRRRCAPGIPLEDLIGSRVSSTPTILGAAAFNERIDSFLLEKDKQALTKWGHTGATGFMALALIVASVGIVSLIAEGYGTLAWSFFFLYLIPLLTIEVWRLIKAG